VTALKLQCAVAAGSALGAVARYAVSLAAIALFGPAFPWGTLAVNVVGSFLIGAYAAAMAADGRWWSSPAMRHFVTAGFCGGFTTFSIFSLETLHLWSAGAAGLAVAYVLSSLVLWLAAVWAGHRLAARLVWPPGPS
jgi:fluoride exporter